MLSNQLLLLWIEVVRVYDYWLKVLQFEPHLLSLHRKGYLVEICTSVNAVYKQVILACLGVYRGS